MRPMSLRWVPAVQRVARSECTPRTVILAAVNRHRERISGPLREHAAQSPAQRVVDLLDHRATDRHTETVVTAGPVCYKVPSIRMGTAEVAASSLGTRAHRSRLRHATEPAQPGLFTTPR